MPAKKRAAAAKAPPEAALITGRAALPPAKGSSWTHREKNPAR